MRANITFVRERFDHFNNLCFDNRLPKVNLRMSSSLRTLGTLRHPLKHGPDTKPSDLTLSISNRLDQDVSVIEDTIIHEMIHLYIFWFGLRDSSAHGQTFKQIMTYINKRFDRKITITHRGSIEEKMTDRLRKPRLVIIALLKSGERCVTVCSPKYTLRILDQLARWKMVDNLEVCASYHTLFSHYPSSRTPKLYQVDTQMLDEALQSAVFLDYQNGKLTPRI